MKDKGEEYQTGNKCNGCIQKGNPDGTLKNIGLFRQ